MTPATADITVVIPTTRDQIETTESVPDAVPVRIERDGSLNEARNHGVRGAETPYVIIMDDDLSFPAAMFDRLCDAVGPRTVVGLEDWDFGLLAGRVMAFHTLVWQDVGGFDERLGSHMGDTAFALKVRRAGYELETLPREIVYHHPHDRDVSTWDRLWRLAYLSLRHPTAAPGLVSGVVR